MGGETVVHLSTLPVADELNVKATLALQPSVFMNPTTHPEEVRVPTYFSTGTWDVLVDDKGVVKDYLADPVVPKVLSDRKLMTHYTDSIIGRNFLLGYYMAFL